MAFASHRDLQGPVLRSSDDKRLEGYSPVEVEAFDFQPTFLEQCRADSLLGLVVAIAEMVVGDDSCSADYSLQAVDFLRAVDYYAEFLR